MSDYLDTSKAGPSSQTDTNFTDFIQSAVTLDALIRKKTYFDKTLFIKAVFEDKNFLIITAPRRMGKTTALNTFRSFVEIDCDKKGMPTDKPIQDTSNYQLFNTKLFDGKTLKIMNERNIVDTHFGKYPVIHLDFQCHDVIVSYEKAVKRCKTVLQEAYKQHDYLFEHPTPKLKGYEQKKCKQWCEAIEDFEETDISDGLKNLCCYLYKNFERKVIVLVDEYDSPIMKALSYIKSNVESKIEDELVTAKGKDRLQLIKRSLEKKVEELGNVSQLSNGILASALKGGVQYVERAIIMGISHIAGVGISGLNNTMSRTFLDKFAYANYFGLTDAEVEELCERYKHVNKLSFQTLKENYNGFNDRNGECHIYLMWSVLSAVDEQTIRRYFEETGTIANMECVFQIPSIRVKIQQLVQMKSTVITIKTKISPDELKALQQESLNPEMFETDSADIFLSFLLEQGYLTYAGTTVECGVDYYEVSVKVPNKEIRAILLGKLRSYYSRVCKLDWPLQNACKVSFDQLFASVENDGFEAAVNVVHENLQNLLQKSLSQKSCLKVNEAAVHISICSLFVDSYYAYCTEFYTDSTSRLDLAIHKGDCGAIIEFKHRTDLSKKTTSDDALQQIKERGYDTLFERQRLFPVPPSKVIFVGLSINDDKNLSITCQIKGKKEKIRVGPPEPDRKCKNPEGTNLRRSKRRCNRRKSN